MSIKCYGVEGGIGIGGQYLLFVWVVEVGGWLYVFGQMLMKNGEVVEGGIVDQLCLVIQNCVDIMIEVGYILVDVVYVKVIFIDVCYFQLFNKVFCEFFGDNLFVCICCVVDLVVDCKVEVDVICFNVV